MAEITKPLSLNIIWSSSGVATAPTTSKYQTGWTIEAPPYQTVNYVFNKSDTVLAHLNQFGFLSWDAETEYQANKSWTRHNGVVYFCKVTNTNQNPLSDVSETYWRPILDGTKVLPAASVSAYGLTLIDDADAATARTTLGGTTVGKALFTTASASAARTTLGATTVGGNVFIAASESAARTAIGVVNSTESLSGIIEIASDAETITGTDNTRALTPAKLRLGFGILLGVTGYISFPTWMGGLVVQWARISVTDDGNTTWTYPIAFPNAAFVGFGTHAQSFDTLEDAGIAVYSMTTTTATIRNGTNAGGFNSLINVLAIGY